MFKKTVFLLFLALASVQGSRAYAAQEPWSSQTIVQPQQLAETLKSSPQDRQPILVHVGFEVLYKHGHIPGSIYAGPANKQSGLNHLREALEKLPRNREVVIYCGCCPFTKCPNVRPAFKVAQQLGFKIIKILYLPDNFDKNWIKKGYPVVSGEK